MPSSQDERPGLVVRIPPILTPKTLRTALRTLPLVARNRPDRHFVVSFAPPKEIETITFIVPKLKYFSATSICSLLGFVDWLKQELSGSPTAIAWRGTENLSVAGLGPNLEALEVSSRRSARTIILPPQRVSIPMLSAADDQLARKELLDQSNRLGGTIITAAPAFGDDYRMRLTIAEMVLEGLLNAYEHAFPSNEEGMDRSAWICAKYVDIQHQASLSNELTGIDELENISCDWVSRRSSAGATIALDVGLVDHGIGLPSSLGPAFVRANSEYAASLDERGRNRWVSVHDKLLDFAFSTYGSRKNSGDFENETVARMWRGLYRVRYRTAHAQGMLVLKSGYGLSGLSAAEGTINLLDQKTLGRVRDLAPIPGTSLTLRLALPIHSRDFSATIFKGTAEKLASIPYRIQISTRERRLFAEPDDKNEYARFVARAFSAFAKETELINPKDKCRYLMVLHPAPTSPVPSGIADEAAAEWRRATCAARILGDNVVPGFIPIHLFMNLTHSDISQLQDMFSDFVAKREGWLVERASPPIPRLVGICDPRDASITWFVFATGQTSDQELARTGELEIGTSPHVWHDFLSLYADVVEFRAHEQKIALRLPKRLAVKPVAEALSILVRELADPQTATEWYWEGGDDEFTRTASGRLVSKFASAYKLCLSEPTLELVFAWLLREFLEVDEDDVDAPVRARKPQLVITDTTASYLLAKRLLRNHDKTARLRVLPVEEVDKARPEDYQLHLFVDAIHTGTRLERVRQQARSQSGSFPAFCTLDLRPAGERASWYVGPEFSCVSWEFPPPVDEATVKPRSVLQVDVLTNEVVSESRNSQSFTYGVLTWRDENGSTNAARVNGRVLEPKIEGMLKAGEISFDCGIQFADGQFHLIRFPTDVALSNGGLFDVTADWLGTLIADHLTKSRGDSDAREVDVVVFVRDESAFRGQTGHKLARLIREKLRADSRWLPHVWIVWVPATHRGHRQHLVHDLQTHMRGATVLSTGQTSTDQSEELAFERRDIKAGFLAIFVDNAAVSARSMRDFAVAVTDFAKSLPAGAIFACPLISRLSPSEEQMFVRTRLLGLKDEMAEPVIPFLFRALFQLRVGTHANLDTISSLQRLKDLLIRLEPLRHIDELRDWAGKISKKIEKISAMPSNFIEQFPFFAEPCEPLRVTSNAVLWRHLIALFEQRVPVVNRLVEVFFDMLSEKDFSVLLFLALEPHLLLNDILGGSLQSELTELALRAMETAENVGLRSASLWVLYCDGEPFSNHQARIARICVRDEFLRPQWLALLLAFDSPRLVAQTLRSALHAINTEQAANQGFRDVREVISTRLAQHDVELPHDQSSARARIYDFVRITRWKHDPARDYGAWLQISESLSKWTLQGQNALPQISAATWAVAEEYLVKVISPTLASVSILLEHKVPRGNWDFPEAASIAMREFKNAKHFYEQQEFGSMKEVWERVSNLTIQKSVEGLYGTNADSVLEHGTREAYGALDFALPKVVQEPVGLLTHALVAGLDRAQNFRIKVIPSITEIPELIVAREDAPMARGRIRPGDWLEMRWKLNDRLPVVWRPASAALRQLFWILAQNISEHGLKPSRCNVEVIEEISESNQHMGSKQGRLLIHIQSKRSPTRIPGRGTGIRTIQKLASVIGAEFTCGDIGVDEYRSSITMPVKWLYLSAIGAGT